jgi:flagellar basal-body rod protein FlgC
MGLFNVFEISSAGMAVEQTKLSVAAANLANARTTRAPDGSVYQPLAVMARSEVGEVSGATTFAAIEQQMTAAALPRPVVTDIVPTNAPVKLLYDPGHPDANEQGMVAYPGVDPLGTMLDLLSISRSYEANLRAFDITRSLIQRTIDIGRNR